MKYQNQDAFEKANMFGTGTPNTAYAQYFIGNSFLNPLTDPKGGLFAANVTFEPGCRNNWHIHHAEKGGGQLLLCTAGEGWYQEAGKPAVSLTPGSVVMIPAEVKHWHGAKKDSWFSHIAVEVPGEGCRNEWCEPVTDEEYEKLYGESSMAVKQTAGRDQLGTFAPKFAELNDDVLFGQVWSREEQLSLRDRSLVTVVALMAQGLTDESFRYHLISAKKNGITKEEMAEIITHAAFYCGWPKAWAVFRMAKEVYGEE